MLDILFIFLRKVHDCIVTFAETWGERHAIAYGAMFILFPLSWFTCDDHLVPKWYPYDVRLAIYADFHYYIFGIVIPIIIIILMIWFYFLIH